MSHLASVLHLFPEVWLELGALGQPNREPTRVARPSLLIPSLPLTG
jgi:hypothetical protein